MRILARVVPVSAFILLASAAARAEHEGAVQAIKLEEVVAPEVYDWPAYNHGPTIAESNKTLTIAWYAGPRDQAESNAIFFSRRLPRGWAMPVQVKAKAGEVKETYCAYPVLFQPARQGAPLLLYYKLLGGPDSWRGAVRLSADGGQTWSAASALPVSKEAYFEPYGRQFLGPTKNRPLELPDGSLLLASDSKSQAEQAHLEKTRDYTKTFEFNGPFPKPAGGAALWQPAFLVHSPDFKKLQLLCRSFHQGRPYSSFSSDGGRTWEEFRELELAGGGALDALSLPNGWHLLAAGDGTLQCLSLCLFLSRDGKNWTKVLTMHAEKVSATEHPALILGSDKKVHLTYSFWGRQRIRYVVLDPEALATAAAAAPPPAPATPAPASTTPATPAATTATIIPATGAPATPAAKATATTTAATSTAPPATGATLTAPGSPPAKK